MSFSSTKANGNVRYYTEKHLQDLDYEGTFPEYSATNMHYGYIAKHIHVYSGETFYMFAKTPKGYVFLNSGEVIPETLGIPRISDKYEKIPLYLEMSRSLGSEKSSLITEVPNISIEDITNYLVEFFDITQLVMADEESLGRESSDSEPNFDMSKYVQTQSGNALSANALPYTITLPYHQKQITITKELVVIKAL